MILVEQKFEILEHTADIGIIAYGKDLKEVFANAAEGMFSLITDLEKVEGKATYRIKLEASDIESLLVTWLNELVYLFDTENILFKRFEVIDINQTSLSAMAYGEKAERTRHTLKLGIKATTYHLLEVKRKGSFYQARVLFDI